MVDLNKIRGRSVLEKLKNYRGSNDYLLQLRKKWARNNFALSTTQIDYILQNHDQEPLILNKVVEITEYLGEQYQKKYELNHTPQKILIEKLLADTEKTYHVKGKLYKNQKHSEIFHVPKTQVITDPFETELSNIEIDFDKYIEMDKAGRKPFKYQEKGIKFLLSKLGCVLADDMGLGKTFQSIIAAIESGAEKILIICPANAKINWAREITNFEDTNNISIIKGSYWRPARFTIINYDILKNFHTLIDRRRKYEDWEIIKSIVDENFDLIICDEAHMIKNPKSQRAKIINDISKKIERVWLLTGTPIANRPMDYYNLLQLCNSPVASNWKHYAFRYCAAKTFKKKTKNGHLKEVWITDGASNLDELNKRTKSIILRRKKEDHLDLPPKIRSPYYLELDNRDQYERVWDEYLEWAKSEGKRLGAGRHMVRLGVLRKFLAQEKVKHTIQLAEQAIEEGKKVIIFTCYTDSLIALKEHFGNKSVIHNGALSSTEKQRSVDSFQNDDKIMVFIGNIISAGTAITLTAAQIVIMNDLDFVPANHEQAEDRAYRIGQDSTVNVYYPIFEDTVDEKIYGLLQKKRDIINQIMGEDGEDLGISTDLVKILLK